MRLTALHREPQDSGRDREVADEDDLEDGGRLGDDPFEVRPGRGGRAAVDVARDVGPDHAK